MRVATLALAVVALAACEDTRRADRPAADREEPPRAPAAVVATPSAGLPRTGLTVTAPGGGPVDPAAPSLVVVVPAQGDVVVQGTVVSEDDLERVFRAAFVRDPKTQVVIQADQDAQHGRVVKLMELAKQVGLTRLAIGTR